MEIIPKKTTQYAFWFNLLFYLALLLVLLSVAAFFILNNSVKITQKTLNALEDELLKEENSQENIANQKEVLALQKKINDFSKLAGQHLASSGVFGFIEKKTHPKTWFSQINIDARKSVVSLSGQTKSFETLGQQLMIFREDGFVKSAALERVAINQEGKIEFGLFLSLDPAIFSPVFSQAD